MTRELNEPVLPDAYPLHIGFIYVVDGVPTEFLEGNCDTVGEWRRYRERIGEPIQEVRMWDLVGRAHQKKMAFPESISYVPPPTDNRRRRRRPRNSHKIKKVT